MIPVVNLINIYKMITCKISILPNGSCFSWARSVDSGNGSLPHRRRSQLTPEAIFGPFEDTFGLAFNIDLSGNETSRISTFGDLLSVHFTELRDVILFALSHIVLLDELCL